ncbi:MAG: hypothetical protein J6K39_00025, partial [Clostridia bacterium]|nr:hypothetical protein [Clostridia bacterium]
LGGTAMRYLRIWSHGNDKNSGNHLSKLEAFDGAGNSVYLFSAETGTGLENFISGTSSGISGSGANAWLGMNSYTTPAVVDLGRTYNVASVNLRRYYADNRMYFGNKLEGSVDGENWFNIYNSYNEGSYEDQHLVNAYFETSGGHNFEVPTELFDMEDFMNFINAQEYIYDWQTEMGSESYIEKNSDGSYTWNGRTAGSYNVNDDGSFYTYLYTPKLKKGIYRFSYNAITTRTADTENTTAIIPVSSDRTRIWSESMWVIKGKTEYSCILTVNDDFGGFQLGYVYGDATTFSNIKLEYLGDAGADGVNARYIRFTSNGSNKNADNHLSVIEIKDGKGNILCEVNAATEVGLEYVGNPGVSNPGTEAAWIGLSKTDPTVIDLKVVYNVYSIKLRRYFADSRYYYGCKIEYSIDGVNWKNFWNSYNEGSYGDDQTINTYAETSHGQTFYAPNEIFDMDDMMRYMNAQEYKWDRETANYVPMVKNADGSYTWKGPSGYSANKKTAEGNGNHLYKLSLTKGTWKISYSATTTRVGDSETTTGICSNKYSESAAGGYTSSAGDYYKLGSISCITSDYGYTFSVGDDFAGFSLGYNHGDLSTFSNIRLEFMG